MRDMLLSFTIGSAILLCATELVGITHFVTGRDPAAAVRNSVPSMPSMPSVSNPKKPTQHPNTPPPPTPTPHPHPPAPPDTTRTMFIAHTSGSGVRMRTACTDGAASNGAVTEGAAVAVIRPGAGECAGWSLVTASGVEFWVRTEYLHAAPTPGTAGPRAPAPASGRGIPDAPVSVAPPSIDAMPEPDPTASLPSPTAVPTEAASPSAAPSSTPPPPRAPVARVTPTPEPVEDDPSS
jgi:hypothetical protein